MEGFFSGVSTCSTFLLLIMLCNFDRPDSIALDLLELTLPSVIIGELDSGDVVPFNLSEIENLLDFLAVLGVSVLMSDASSVPSSLSKLKELFFISDDRSMMLDDGLQDV